MIDQPETNEIGPARGIRGATLALSDIKLAHSVFALPFAVLGAFLATPVTRGSTGANDWKRFFGQLALVVGCMFLARTWAMLVNRLADKNFDAKNPRTAKRVFAAGKLASQQGWAVASITALGFITLCGAFWAIFANPWPLLLSVPTLAWIAFYSYTKRFTALAHLFLGGALALSPIAAAIAVDPDMLPKLPALWLLAGMVLLWVAGFDVAYALQDVEFDRTHALRSIPALLGVSGALWVSRAMHAGALALLGLAARSDARFGVIFGCAVVAVGLLLVFEHMVLEKRGVAGLPLAFFTVNGIVSCVLGTAGVVDLLV